MTSELKRNIHAEMVLEWWKLAGELNIQFFSSYLKNEIDADILTNLIAMYRRLLVELKEKIDDEILAQKMKELEKFIYNPRIAIENINIITEIELFIRKVLESCNYTKYTYDVITK